MQSISSNFEFQVATAYRNLYGKELIQDLQGELSTDKFNAFLQTISNNRINNSSGSSSSSTSSSGAYTAPQRMIVAKRSALTLQTNASSLNYNLEYHYNAAKPHQLEAVVDQSSGDVQQFTYNESGSIKLIHDNTQDQEFYWNEEQRRSQ